PIRRDYTDSSPDSQPKPERMTNIELGYKVNASRISAGINGYAMLYKDQLVATGYINDVGSIVRENVESSYRAGIELDVNWKPFDSFTWLVAATFSQNKINDYTYYTDILDEEDDYAFAGTTMTTLDKTNIALSANT